MNIKNTYDHIHHISQRAHLLDGISGLLGWDQETYMPKDAAHIRAKQRELLSELSHTIKTSKDFERALSSLIDLDTGAILGNVGEREKAALRVWRRDFLRLKKLPTAFVQNFTKLTSEAIHVWQKAKQQNNYPLFRPYLEQIIEQLKIKTELLGYQDHPYDALLDDFEPGCKTSEINVLFQDIKSNIAPFIKRHIQQSSEQILSIELTADEQMYICNMVLDSIGYNRSRGRLDISEHPFSSSAHPTDCRITTRLEKAGFYMPVLTTLHEAGHGFYEMGLPEDQYGSPLGESVSLGVHESQSRFWETRIGRSLPFWEFFLPQLRKRFPGRFDSMQPEQLLQAMNRIQPSFIRVDADEVTYPLHVILRFEIEKELIEGSLKAEHLPERWNAEMKDTLGIEPLSDREGCLQDIHGSMGGFGYFPTYTLGNLFAAELFIAFEKDHSDWQQRVRSGDFSFITAWHREHIHQYGRQFSSKELIERTTKKTISCKAYIDYLKEKYFHYPKV